MKSINVWVNSMILAKTNLTIFLKKIIYNSILETWRVSQYLLEISFMRVEKIRNHGLELVFWEERSPTQKNNL
jgi:hypothetical protein